MFSFFFFGQSGASVLQNIRKLNYTYRFVGCNPVLVMRLVWWVQHWYDEGYTRRWCLFFVKFDLSTTLSRFMHNLCRSGCATLWTLLCTIVRRVLTLNYNTEQWHNTSPRKKHTFLIESKMSECLIEKIGYHHMKFGLRVCVTWRLRKRTAVRCVRNEWQHCFLQ